MIGGVVLAAGASRRFGSPKLVELLGSKPLLRWTVERACASSVGDLVVVVAPGAAAVRATLAGLRARVVESARSAEGIGHSIASGVGALDARAEGVVVILGDQPTVTATIVDRLIDGWRMSRAPIVVPRYAGVRGNPVLFDRTLFSALRALAGDEGARELIAGAGARVRMVDFPFPMPADVDTIEALERMRSEAWARRA